MAWFKETAATHGTESIPYRFDDQELDDMRRDLPRQLARMHAEIDEKATVMKGYSDRIKEMSADIAETSNAINTGMKIQDMYCYLVPDHNERRMDYYVEGKDKPVFSRPLRADEMQENIHFLNEEARNGKD